MKKSNRKGFTIVELVIVIAVIAILAAVLIPTFSNLIKKANVANDTAVARNMNTALAEYSATNGVPETFEEVLDALKEAGYVLENLNAKANGNIYAWDKTNNQIVYLDAEGGVIYKNTDFLESDLMYIIADDKAEDAASLENLLEDGKSVALQADVVLDKTILIPAGSKVVLDLGEKTLKTEQAAGVSEYLRVQGELTIVNGTFEGRGVRVDNGGKVVVGEGVTVNAVDDNGGAVFYVFAGGEVVIDGGTFTAKNGTNGDAGENEPGLIFNFGKVTINGGNFEAVTATYAIRCNSDEAEMTINDGSFTSSRGVIYGGKGTVTINGGTFKVAKENANATATSAGIVTVDEGSVVINGGTFINEAGGNDFYVSEDTTTGTITVKPGVVVGDTTVTKETVYGKVTG